MLCYLFPYRFSVEEIAMTDSYNLDLDLAVCFGSQCLIQEPLLVGANIAKTVCSYRQDYKTPGTRAPNQVYFK